MANMNRCIYAGTLGRDPEVRFFANETAVANFSLALNRKYKSKDGERREETTWIEVQAWGRTAELCGQYLTKGRQALVEGRMKQESWEGKDGSKRTKLVCVAENVQFLGGREDGGRQEEPGPSVPPPAPAPNGDDGDPPF